MNGTLVFVVIVGIFALVIGMIVYSVLIDQPRLRRQLQQESQERGWTYTPGKSLIVARTNTRGYLISPKETIVQSFRGTDQGINWGIDQLAVAHKSTNSSRYNRQSGTNSQVSISNHIIWHCEDVRIEHGSVLLYVKPLGWTQSGDAQGLLKTGVQALHSNLVFQMLRENLGIGNTPVSLDLPTLEAKYQVEVSDIGAAKAALTPAVCDFLIAHRPLGEAVIQLADNALDIVVSDDGTYVRKFEKLVALKDYGIQLAQVVTTSQSGASPVAKPDAPANQTRETL